MNLRSYFALIREGLQVFEQKTPGFSMLLRPGVPSINLIGAAIWQCNG